MSAVGQAIQDLITIKDDAEVGILGLTEASFETLEAFLLSTPATTAPVTITELSGGLYVAEFTPSAAGRWILHWIYVDVPTYVEDAKEHEVSSTATISVVGAGGTWTYTGDLTDPTQEVRFLIQDTDESYPIFTDAEVAYALGASADNARKAASVLVQRLMARYAAMADTTELDLSVRASQLYDHYKDLLTSLNSPYAGNLSVVPYAGGISGSDILANQANRDRRAGVFDRNNPQWQRYP